MTTLHVRVVVEVPDKDLSALVSAVAFLLRTAGPLPLPGDKADMTVNGNAMQEVASAWRRFPPALHVATAIDGTVLDRMGASV